MTTGDGEGHVRITNVDIYRALTRNTEKVASLDQTVREVVLPTQQRHDKELDTLKKTLYAITIGLASAGFTLNQIGII